MAKKNEGNCFFALFAGAAAFFLFEELWNTLSHFFMAHYSEIRITVLCIGVIGLIMAFYFKARTRGNVLHKKDRNNARLNQQETLAPNYSKELYKRVQNSYPFRVKRPMNTAEQIAHEVIEKTIMQNSFCKEFHVVPQIALGAILTHSNKRVFSAINSKRCDFILFNRNWLPVAGIEINGTGHNLAENTEWRDATKRHVLEHAGMLYIAIEVKDSTRNVVESAVEEKVLTYLPQIEAGILGKSKTVLTEHKTGKTDTSYSRTLN